MTSNFYQPNFMAHTYKVIPKSVEVEIRTDNKPYMGEDPYLSVYACPLGCWKEENQPMKYENGLYKLKVENYSKIKYHIDYKDTGKTDLKDGKDYEVNYLNLSRKASLATRIQHRQPLVHTINPGKTVGKILSIDKFPENIEQINEPFILVMPSLEYYKVKNPNLVGMIYTAEDCASLSHESAQLRQNTDVCTCIYDPETIERLEKLNGQKVELEAGENFIRFDKTDKPTKPKIYPKIDVPKLKPCDKILTSKEYSTDVIGAKAVNLRRLEELKEQGKIDVIIPKSIALPHGYIQNLWDNDIEQEEYYLEHKDIYPCKEACRVIKLGDYAEKKMFELRKILKENGINSNRLIVRSAFNSEDLPNYSAAGLYNSDSVWLNETEEKNNIELYITILNGVARSKWNKDAINSRKKYQIPDENVQPGAILQDHINSDYVFTVYTDDNNEKLKIDLFAKKIAAFGRDVYQPHVFSYDKKSGELSYDSVQMADSSVTFDEQGNIIDIDPIEEDLSNNKKILEQVKKVVDNALVVEKEFGVPQDIEGGLKGNDIYFWQTRNIVK